MIKNISHNHKEKTCWCETAKKTINSTKGWTTKNDL